MNSILIINENKNKYEYRYTIAIHNEFLDYKKFNVNLEVLYASNTMLDIAQYIIKHKKYISVIKTIAL